MKESITHDGYKQMQYFNCDIEKTISVITISTAEIPTERGLAKIRRFMYHI